MSPRTPESEIRESLPRNLRRAFSRLEVTVQLIASLTPHANNPRTHSKRQVRQIADSIEAFGWTLPILVDNDGMIIAGHGRLDAAKLLGLEEIPTIRLDHMTEAQKRAYVIADNRLAELAGWDFEVLGHELEALIDLDIDEELTGFAGPEIDLIIEGLSDTPEDDPADRLPPFDPEAPAFSMPGDLWVLGDHRLLCGNALVSSSYTALMAGKRARMVFADPPYNVPVDGHVSGLGKKKHQEFAMASGEMTVAQFIAFLDSAFGLMAVYSLEGSLHFICIDWRHLFELLTAGRSAYDDLKNLIVWAKTNAGMGSFYRSQHELIAVFKNGTGPHINNVELGRHGRNRTNLWTYAGVNSFGEGRDEALAVHPAVKPVALVADAILDCTKRGDIVLDPFCGSGTTIMAAERTGRRCYAMEIDPAYVDTAIRRWQNYTGGDAVLAATGQTFNEIQEPREDNTERKETEHV